ncbi:NADP-dependent 3-hydroxy acid dehydrogenase YdfG [Paraburkholderia steynii]|uniref:NADP-dependent 3-hydroxy acid dehydrogenase YdfG n=1 Tax=Paraburkholderia steynii TaxID=1245441 RepID=A0A7Z7BG44_9BURK|nr:SDR family NAD(P)-dependent oxidoreductase [Paraburkholderia steynii]SDJ15755.1 NADP-dependent 3-hydroxy acid dehydrogenase YdfG [Paraburkholderia steynii]
MSDSIVVTGVSSGIGYEIARHFIKNGYRVFGSVRSDDDGKRLTNELGPEFFPLCFDVTDPHGVWSAARQVSDIVGDQGLMGLVNNAGVSACGPLMHLPVDEIRALFEVNVLGVICVTQAFLPLLGACEGACQLPGRVVNISSVSGAVAVPFFGAYAGTKHALEAVTQAFRRELTIYGIEVISVEPGFVKTAMFAKTGTQCPTSRFSGTAYELLWQTFQQALARFEGKAKGAESVVRAVHRALTAARPKTRYPLDPLWWIGRLLSDRQFDRVIFGALGLTKVVRQVKLSARATSRDKASPHPMGGANIGVDGQE